MKTLDYLEKIKSIENLQDDLLRLYEENELLLSKNNDIRFQDLLNGIEQQYSRLIGK